jgi:hypothetical protein
VPGTLRTRAGYGRSVDEAGGPRIRVAPAYEPMCGPGFVALPRSCWAQLAAAFQQRTAVMPGACRTLPGRDGPARAYADLSGLIGPRIGSARKTRSGPYFVSH